MQVLGGLAIRAQAVPHTMVLVDLRIPVLVVHVILDPAVMNILDPVAQLMMVQEGRDIRGLAETRTLVPVDPLMLDQAGHAMTVLVGLVIQDLAAEINVLRYANRIAVGE